MVHKVEFCFSLAACDLLCMLHDRVPCDKNAYSRRGKERSVIITLSYHVSLGFIIFLEVHAEWYDFSKLNWSASLLLAANDKYHQISILKFMMITTITIEVFSKSKHQNKVVQKNQTKTLRSQREIPYKIFPKQQKLFQAKLFKSIESESDMYWLEFTSHEHFRWSRKHNNDRIVVIRLCNICIWSTSSPSYNTRNCRQMSMMLCFCGLFGCTRTRWGAGIVRRHISQLDRHQDHVQIRSHCSFYARIRYKTILTILILLFTLFCRLVKTNKKWPRSVCDSSVAFRIGVGD